MSALTRIDDLPSDELANLASQLRATLESPGWQVLREFMAAEQHARVNVILQQPASREDPGSYALRHAHDSGYARGLRQADVLGAEIVQRAERKLAEHQAAAELAARFNHHEEA